MATGVTDRLWSMADGVEHGNIIVAVANVVSVLEQ
jgi:hypothetical protein